MSEPSPAYRDCLLNHYEAEIEAEAYFETLATAASNPDQARKLYLLAEVERHAAGAIAPLLARHGLRATDRQVLLEKGRAEARGAPSLWSALIADMRSTYPGYIAAMEVLEAMSPAEDRTRLAFFTEHERAVLAFLDLEAPGAAESAAPLRRYLAASPGKFRRDGG
jgi:hypothetical protein